MKKNVIIGITVLVIAVGSIAAVFLLKRSNNPQNPDTSKSTEQSSSTAKKAEDGTPVTNVEQKQQSTQAPKITISNLSQDSSTVYVRTVIEGVAQGDCTLIFSKSGQTTVTKTAPIIPATSYYACQGFNVSKQELPSKGTWTVKITVNNGEATNTIDVN